MTIAACLFLAAAVWVVFGQTLHHGFINLDDDVTVYENPIITQGLDWHSVVQLFTRVDPMTHDWWPLNEFSHMLDWQFYGANASGHHLTNVLLHTAAVICLFLVLRTMTGAFWRSAFVAAVFAIHPLRVESVAWVSERKDILSGLFFMLTLWAYMKYLRFRNCETHISKLQNSSKFFYVLSLLFYVLGLLSKTMLVTLPFVLVLLDYWPLGRMPVHDFKKAAVNQPHSTAHPSSFAIWRRLLFEKVPFLLLSVASCIVTVAAQKNTNFHAAQTVSFFVLIGQALAAYVAYLWHMVYPLGLALIYSHPGEYLSVGKIALSVLVLAIISAAVMSGWRKFPYLVVGWLWYLGMLVPVIVMQNGINVRADRYTYLPQIGLYILITWGAAELCANWRHCRFFLGFVASAIIACLILQARAQTAHWKDSTTLWTHTLASGYESAPAHNSLGYELESQGKWKEAVSQYERAIQLDPDHPEAQNNLGSALASQGKWDEAILHYERSIQVNPNDAKTCINLGNALTVKRKLPEAVRYYERAIQINPDSALAHFSLGNALINQSKPDQAIIHFQKAIALATAQNKPELADEGRAMLKSFQPPPPKLEPSH